MFKFLVLSLATAPLTVASSPACLDARGLPVLVQEAPIADFGHASLDKTGKPVIVLNALLLKKLPPAVGKFILYHECGHHALGHLLGVGSVLTDEQAADCWAARSMVLTGELEPHDLRNVSDIIGHLNHGMLNSEPGVEPWRAENLGVCLKGLPAGAASPEESEIGRFFQWPMIGSPKAGTHFFLRTRLRNGVLQYVATVTDNGGRTERHFARKQGRDAALPIQIALSSGSGSRLCTITIPDSLFLKIGRTGYFDRPA